jgi:hypothetical protein
VPPPWLCESWEATKGEVSNLRRWSGIPCPAGFGPESDCAGEGRKRLWAADPSSRRGGRPASAGPRLSDSGGSLVVGPGWVLCSGADWPTDRRS